MRRRHGSQIISFAAYLVLAAPLEASDQKKKEFEVPVKWEFRLRSELRTNFDLNDAIDDDSHPLLQRFRFSIAPRWKSLRFLVQIQDSPVWFRDRSPYSSADFHLYQLFFEAPVGRGFSVRAGRQELSAGEERLLGVFNWDNRGRVFDSVSLNREGKDESLSVFAASLAAPRQRDFARGQNLFGVIWKRVRGSKTLESYGYWLHDQTVLKGEERSGRARIFTAGARLNQKLGRWRHNVEAAWQVGSRNRDPHRAAAVTWRSDYTWKVRYSPSLGFEYSFATGDGNLVDHRSHEFHNLYATNHPFYGYMDLFGWRNLNNPRVILALEPWVRTRLEANYHDFWLAESQGPWKNARGQVLGRDPSGLSGRRVGGEVDLLGSYSVSHRWKFLIGYSAFFPGEFARATRGRASAQFTYLQLLLSY